MALHAKLSASKAERWLNCPGSIRLCGKIQGKPSGVHAMVGSIAHKVGQLCLDKNLNPDSFLGKGGQYANDEVNIVTGKAPTFPAGAGRLQVSVDSKMVSAVTVYVNEIRRKRAEAVGAKYYTEKELDLLWLFPESGGTADSAIIEPLGRLYVDDFKNGFGVVEIGTIEKPNPQFAIYGLGAIGKGNPNMIGEVELTVIQPNAIHSDGPIRSLTMTVDQLMDWANRVLVPGAARALSPNAELVAGPWCRWCEANDPSICSAVCEQLVNVTQIPFGDILSPVPNVLPDPMVLGGEALGNVVAFGYVFEEWIKSCRAEAKQRLLDGSPDAPPQYKIVRGNASSRSWGVPGETVVLELQKHVKDSRVLYSLPDLLSPTQMEKELKLTGIAGDKVKEVLAPLIAPVTYGETLTTVDDKRPAVVSGNAMFPSTFNPLAA